MQYTVKLGLNGLTYADQVEKGRMHVEKLTGNQAFTLPAGLLPLLSKACDALEKANLQVIDNGGKSDHLVRRQCGYDVHGLIKEVMSYVQAQAGNDLNAINSSGFQVRKKNQPVGIPSAPDNLRVSNTKLPGELKSRWDAVEGRIFYEVWMTSGDPSSNEGWSLLGQTSRNYYVATGLASGIAYSFKVNAVTVAGAGTLSLAVTAKAA